jgi:hypothetical protein
MNSYTQAAQQAGQANTKYNDAFNSRQNYGDIYQQARDKYMNTDEINAARGTYQGAREAVDQMNTTINKLPESIRQQYGGTGLTEAQRARAMGDQYQQNANTANYLNTNYQNASSDYNDLANRSMQEVQNVAGGNYQGQQDALGMLQSAWSTLLGQQNAAYGQNQGDRGLLADQFGARDQYNLSQEQLALERWKEEQANARAAADRQNQLNLQKYLASSNERIAGMSVPKPTKTVQSAYQAPTNPNAKPDAANMYKAWSDAPMLQRILSAPMMMFNGY